MGIFFVLGQLSFYLWGVWVFVLGGFCWVSRSGGLETVRVVLLVVGCFEGWVSNVFVMCELPILLV